MAIRSVFDCVEGRGQEVLGALCKSFAAVGVRGVGGEHQHREVRTGGEALDQLQDRSAVHVRHVQLEEHEVGLEVSQPAKHPEGAGFRDDVIQPLLLEQFSEERDVAIVIVDDEDRHVRVWLQRPDA